MDRVTQKGKRSRGEKKTMEILKEICREKPENIKNIVKKSIEEVEGLNYCRGHVWWMTFTYRGKQIRKSTETEDRKLAQRIYDKVRGEIAEGKWFEKLPGEERSFRELMEKFLSEHASKKKSAERFKGIANNLISFMGDLMVSEITPRIVNEYKIKRYKDGIKPANLNREISCLKKAYKEWEWIKSFRT